MTIQIDLIFLLKAIKEKKSIDIFFKENYTTYNYYSRFLNLDSEGHSIIIDLPILDEDTYKPIIIGQQIHVTFNLAGFRFQFLTEVIEETTYRLDKTRQVPALKIIWPDEIKNNNRRSFFRIQVSTENLIKARYLILGKETKDKQKFSLKEFDKKGVEAIIFDISKNGLAIKIKDKTNIIIEDKLRIYFQLVGKKKEDIEIEGTVKYIRDFTEPSIHLYGIEFTSQKTKQYEQSLKRISRYTMSKRQENISFFPVRSSISKNKIVQKIIRGEVTDELLEMILDKEFPLTNQDYLESLVHILHYERFKNQILSILKSIPINIKLEYIQKTDANHNVSYYILTEALSNSNQEIITAIINKPYLPVEFWLKIAKEGTESMLKIIMRNKNKLIVYPEIMEVIKKNPKSSNSIKKEIKKIEESYQTGLDSEAISEKKVIEDISQNNKEQVKEKAKDKKSPKIPETQPKVLELLQQINKMSVQERIKLALSGNKSQRMILARDSNKFVILSLLECPGTGNSEINILLKNKTLSKEILDRILDNINLIKNYSVRLSLLKHPNVPVKRIPPFIKKLYIKDMKEIIKDKNINSKIRDSVQKLYDKEK